ncbi:MAG: hypothetical protein ACLSVD_06200 [Eggerthellaceae bacterium]
MGKAWYRSSLVATSCLNAGSVTGSGLAAGSGVASGHAAGIMATPSGDETRPKATIKDCLSIGAVSADNDEWIDAFSFATGGVTVENSYYLDTIAGGKTLKDADPAASKTVAQLQTWGAAYQLNGGAAGGDAADKGNVADMDVWTWAGTGEYPSLIKHNAAGAVNGQRMAAADDWGQVGRWVEDFDPKDASGNAIKPEMSRVLPPTDTYPSFYVTIGSGAENPLKIETPEAFAWFADRVNNAGDSPVGGASTKFRDAFVKLVQSDADAAAGTSTVFDLSGAKYGGSVASGDVAGTTVDEQVASAKAKYAGALKWIPVGDGTNLGAGEYVRFNGNFSAAGTVVENLHVQAVQHAGLFGCAYNGGRASGVTIEDVSVTGGYVESSENVAGGVLGGTASRGQNDRVSLARCSNAANRCIPRRRVRYNAGGLVGIAPYASFDRCRNDGTVKGGYSGGGICGGSFAWGGHSNTHGYADCMNTGSVWGGNCAGGICGNSGYGGKISSASNCYNVGSVEGGTDGLHALFVPEDSTSGVSSVTNCYYLDTLPADTYGTPKTAAEFAIGQVAWLLDHPLAGGVMNASSGTAGSGNGVWGQRLQRDAMGELVTTPLSTGDAYPAFRGTEHPAVARMDYTFHDELGSPSPVVDAKDLFLNEGSMMALATSGTSTPWAHYSDNGYTNKLDNPYNTGATGVAQSPAGYYPVFVKLGIASWADVGKLQDETDLRNTYWDASSSTWINDGSTPAAGTAALEGNAQDGFTIRSEKAFAWWAYQVSMSATGFRAANATLEAAAGHAGTFDLAGEEYGYGADASVTEDGTVATAQAKYAGCLPWAGVSEYEGSFDGGNVDVRNLYMSKSTAVAGMGMGLFCTLSGGSVQNVRVASGYVDGESRGYVGAVVGLIDGTATIAGCENAATVTGGGAAFIGGVAGAGYRRSSVDMSRCGNSGMVSTSSPDSALGVGGVLGGGTSFELTLSDCYNVGALPTANDAVGGLVGNMKSGTAATPITIANSYSAGAASGKNALIGNVDNAPGDVPITVSNNYYDSSVIGGGENNGAMPLTTQQLQTWGAAYQLNGGATGGGSITDPGNVAGMGAWTWTGAGEYPSLIPHDASGAVGGQHMANAADWGQVGAWVENFNPMAADGTTPIRPAYSSGIGSAAGNPIPIETRKGWLGTPTA